MRTRNVLIVGLLICIGLLAFFVVRQNYPEKDAEETTGPSKQIVYRYGLPDSYGESTDAALGTYELTTAEKAEYTLPVPTKDYVLKNGFPVNEAGQSYGPAFFTKNDADSAPVTYLPELILAQGDGGAVGYVKASDCLSCKTSAEDIDAGSPVGESGRTIPVYTEDGQTVVDIFSVSQAQLCQEKLPETMSQVRVSCSIRAAGQALRAGAILDYSERDHMYGGLELTAEEDALPALSVQCLVFSEIGILVEASDWIELPVAEAKIAALIPIRDRTPEVESYYYASGLILPSADSDSAGFVTRTSNVSFRSSRQ